MRFAKKTPPDGPAAPSHGRPRAANGFTLTELLVVLAIIGLLTTIVAINVLPRLDQADGRKAAADIATLSQALEIHRLDAGRYPTTAEGLGVLASGPAAAVKKLPDDPWGRPYQYRSPGEHGDFDLWSFGADGAAGGEGKDADVTSWAKA